MGLSLWVSSSFVLTVLGEVLILTGLFCHYLEWNTPGWETCRLSDPVFQPIELKYTLSNCISEIRIHVGEVKITLKSNPLSINGLQFEFLKVQRASVDIPAPHSITAMHTHCSNPAIHTEPERVSKVSDVTSDQVYHHTYRNEGDEV
jgi:hypothetical protein